MTAQHKDPDIPPELIKEYLEEEDMTPGQLARCLHVAETTVHRWLKGEAKPTGTAKAVLWTLIGLGVVFGAGALRGASLAARLFRGATIGAGAISSGIGIYRLLKKRLETAGVDDPESAVEALKKKQEQEQKVEALREQLAQEERKLKELERMVDPGTPGEGKPVE